MAYRHDMLHAGLSVVEVLGGEEQRDAKSCNDWNHELAQDLSCSGFPTYTIKRSYHFCGHKKKMWWHGLIHVRRHQARACPRGMPPHQSLAKGKELANPYEYFSSGQSRFTPFLQPAKGGNCLIEGVMPRPGHRVVHAYD